MCIVCDLRVCVLEHLQVPTSVIRALNNAWALFDGVGLDWKLESCRYETLVGLKSDFYNIGSHLQFFLERSIGNSS